MKGDANLILDLLNNKNCEFIIPVYQRNYDWSIKQCEQLFNDLTKVIANDLEKHFFGAIVYKPETSKCFTIIDGQQRITTVSLLMIAVYKLLKDGIVKSKECDDLDDDIYKSFLANNKHGVERKLKLKPVKGNKKAYDMLFDDEKFFIRGNNITENFEYFCSRIKNMKCSIDELYDAIYKLEIMEISLNDPADDPQIIFESLNSTGLDLNEADKVRNFVLMSLPSTIQETYFNKYWEPIENYTRGDNFNDNDGVSNFIRHYLTIKTPKIPSKSNVYEDFKTFCDKPEKRDIKLVLEEMKTLAFYYKQIKDANTNSKKINRLLKRLNLLDRDVVMPFLLAEVMEYYEDKIMEDDLFDMIKAIDAYVFRRFICGLPTNTLNKTFGQAHRDIVRLKKENDNAADVLIYILKNKKGNGKFPDDKEFKQAFLSKDLYHIQSVNRTYMFECLENLDSKDDISIAEKIIDGSLSVEHIMPQKVNADWKNDLGDKWEEVHTKYLNCIGNLTITGYNGEYSNSPFKIKKEIEGGFNVSPYHINEVIKDTDIWNEEKIIKRGKSLADFALKYWNIRESNYISPVQLKDKIPMGDDDYFVGRLIKGYEFNDVEVTVNSWVELLVLVLKQVYIDEPAKMYLLPDNLSITNKVGIDKSLEDGYIEIGNDLYVYKNNSTYNKVRTLRGVFNCLDIDTSSLFFILQPIDKN